MAGKSYRSLLKAKKYEKIYCKNCKTLLNARFMHLIIQPKDVAKNKVFAYERKSDDGLLMSSCILQFVKLASGVSLQYASFHLYKRIDINDQAFKNSIISMMKEQNKIEERLEDDYGFIIIR